MLVPEKNSGFLLSGYPRSGNHRSAKLNRVQNAKHKTQKQGGPGPR
jgi:hypothetical protein